MALIGVQALDESALGAAREWASRLKAPLLTAPTAGKGVKLLVGDSSVSLAFADVKRGKPFHVDFLTREWRARWKTGLPRRHIFRRAFGDEEGALRVIDATAGFGQDSMMMLCLGFEVTALERSSAIAAVLADGVSRAAREDESLRPRLEKFKLVEADALEFLKAPSGACDAVYLDPMFIKPKKSAKSPKEMQLLQELLAPADAKEEERLFEAAYAACRKRVIVKRPLKAKALCRAPTHSYKGQSIRYDVYVKA